MPTRVYVEGKTNEKLHIFTTTVHTHTHTQTHSHTYMHTNGRYGRSVEGSNGIFGTEKKAKVSVGCVFTKKKTYMSGSTRSGRVSTARRLFDRGRMSIYNIQLIY
jgi:hypothetical protein